MRMQEICRACGVTRKALDYYEAKGLIAPARTENGYRDFTVEDAARLDEISLLRRLGLSVEEIRAVLFGSDRRAALRACIARQDGEAQRLAENRRALARLCGAYNVAREKALLDGMCETMQEKLLLAFPGFFGQYLALHFGRFLDVPLDTDDKRAACAEMLAWLDDVRVPETLEALMRELYGTEGFFSSASALEENTHAAIEAMLADPEAYFAQNAECIGAYLAVRQSEAYRNSPAARLTELLADFQHEAGYREVFLESLCRISPDYREYLTNLRRADEALAGALEKGNANELQMPCS